MALGKECQRAISSIGTFNNFDVRVMGVGSAWLSKGCHLPPFVEAFFSSVSPSRVSFLLPKTRGLLDFWWLYLLEELEV